MSDSSKYQVRIAAAGALAFALGIGLSTRVGPAAATPEPAVQEASILQALQTPTSVQARPESPLTIERAAEISAGFTSIAEDITPAVVRIRTERTITAAHGRILRDLLPDSMGLDHPPIPDLAGGTGFLVTSNGVILTNNHVIEGAEGITVALLDKREFPARVLGRDPTTDIAVIKIEAASLPAVRLGDSEAARVGEWVLAVGNPGFGSGNTLDFTVTGGIISAKGRPLEIIPRELYANRQEESVTYAIEDFIQTDAVINPGNSGGPLVNLAGEVIGINTAIASGTGFYQGYGFAIPINLARRVMTDLVEHGRVRRALLGITIADIDAEDAEVYGLATISGVKINDFAPASPAAQAGLERHDVIVGIDGVAVERLAQLQRLVAQRRPEDVATVQVIRYGSPLLFDVRLTEAAIPEPPQPPRSPVRARERGAEALGLVLGEITGRIARERSWEPGGAYVMEVADFSPAGRKRVAKFDRILAIDREEVGSARAAQALLRRVDSGDVVSLTLRDPTGATRIANIRMP